MGLTGYTKYEAQPIWGVDHEQRGRAGSFAGRELGSMGLRGATMPDTNFQFVQPRDMPVLLSRDDRPRAEDTVGPEYHLG